ncbi:SdpI family protein [Pontibacter harenae]|uniref:SdpI family protein n=1 Tax=Pontibacter harenae TaxID=2894083 RepID=UPI001E492CFA|nr:SdpI family protein [Pontibacter harenae]
MLFIPKLDPKGKIENMGSKYDWMRLLMVLIMAGLATFIIYNAQNQNAFNPNLLFILIGGLFVVIGNYFPALKPNYFIGIRTPWTLEGESVWKKTHRMSGPLWLFGGLAIIAASLLPYNSLRIVVFIAIVAIITLIPVAHSFLELRREKRTDA